MTKAANKDTHRIRKENKCVDLSPVHVSNILPASYIITCS